MTCSNVASPCPNGCMWTIGLCQVEPMHCCIHPLSLLMCRLCTVHLCPLKMADDFLIQFYGTPTWHFCRIGGKIVQIFCLRGGCLVFLLRAVLDYSLSWSCQLQMTPFLVGNCPLIFLQKIAKSTCPGKNRWWFHLTVQEMRVLHNTQPTLHDEAFFHVSTMAALPW